MLFKSTGDEDLDEEEVKESVDDIQMNVDDQEYEDFLKSEFNNESNKKEEINKQTNQIKKSSPDDKSNKDKLSKKEQQNLINELAFPSVNENLDNCKQNPIKNEKGWMNLWNQTQLEIQELEMRANAIKTMMEKSKFKKENALQNSSNNQLLDNIDSEYDYVSDEDEKSELNCSNEVMTKDKKVDERISQSKSNKSEDEEKQINEIIEDEYLVIKVENPKHHKSHKNHKKKDKNSKKSNRSEDKANENRSEKSRQKISGESRTSKLEQLKKDENRVSVESGEIFDDEEDNEHIEKIIKNKNIDNLIKKTRSPSITSSIDSFGRNRRRRSYSSQESDQSFSSLDEILREAEEEQNLSKSDIKLKSQINKSNSKHHHKHHHKHQKSKKQRTPKSHSDEY